MSGDAPPPGRRPGGKGTLEPVPASTLVVVAVVALAAGWLLHYVSERIGTAPVVTWTQPALLFLLAAMLGLTAWSTWRTLHVRRETLAPAQAVNRLVLARASALVGAAIGGGYLGYAISWIGSPDQLADERGWRSGAAALAGLLLVVAGLLLERACRVKDDDPRSGAGA